LDFAGLSYILDRPYFARTWVVQELVLAKALRFYIGNIEVPLDLLLRGIGLETRLNQIPGGGHSNSYASVLTPPFIFQARDQYASGSPWPLRDYISLCRDRDVSEPRGKVFSLLGIAEKSSLALDTNLSLGLDDDAQLSSGSPSSATAQLRADYSKNVDEVYLGCTKCLLRESGLSHVLSIVGKTEKGVEGIPSWFPDCSAQLRPKSFQSIGATYFKAATEITSSFSISDDGKTLSLRAATFDSIATFGESSKD
jgi:hypothetical protein